MAAVNNKIFDIVTRLEKNDPDLTELILVNKKLGDVEAKSIAAALKTNTHLTRLNLANNKIGDAGALAIVNALNGNDTLEELCLDFCGIANAGMVALVELSISNNNAVCKLSIKGNVIDNEGAILIAEIAKTEYIPIELDLFHSKINDSGMKALAEALINNQIYAVKILDVDMYLKADGNIGMDRLRDEFSRHEAVIKGIEIAHHGLDQRVARWGLPVVAGGEMRFIHLVYKALVIYDYLHESNFKNVTLDDITRAAGIEETSEYVKKDAIRSLKILDRVFGRGYILSHDALVVVKEAELAYGAIVELVTEEYTKPASGLRPKFG